MEKYSLLLILVGGTYALPTVPKTKCDATQIITSCTTVPGGNVYIKLTKYRTNNTLAFYKDLPGKSLLVFAVTKGQVKIQEEYRNRADFDIYSGTLKITDVEEDDAGQYSLDVYNRGGILVKTLSFTLQVKERRVSFAISVSAPAFLVLVIGVCFVLWKCKPWTKSGYETLN